MTMAERAKAGAKLLDFRRPGWARIVSPAGLDMSSCVDDVLGQLFGEFGEGKKGLGIEMGWKYGFDIGSDEWVGKDDDDPCGSMYEELKRLWIAEIEQRLKEPVAS